MHLTSTITLRAAGTECRTPRRPPWSCRLHGDLGRPGAVLRSQKPSSRTWQRHRRERSTITECDRAPRRPHRAPRSTRSHHPHRPTPGPGRAAPGTATPRMPGNQTTSATTEASEDHCQDARSAVHACSSSVRRCLVRRRLVVDVGPRPEPGPTTVGSPTSPRAIRRAPPRPRAAPRRSMTLLRRAGVGKERPACGQVDQRQECDDLPELQRPGGQRR